MNGSKASTAGEAKGGGGRSGSKGDSHRIYWQQWPPSAIASGVKPSRRDIITGSAAVRISPDGARAQDVTQLLCETLNLKGNNGDSGEISSPSLPGSPRQESWDKVQDAWERDCLVLVGTLYSLPLHHVRFRHEQQQLDAQLQKPITASKGHPGLDDSSSQSLCNSTGAAATTRIPLSSKSDPPFHVIKSLSPTDHPIQVRDAMIEHLKRILAESSAAALASSNPSKPASTIAPKLQWYFVPGMNHPSSPIPSFVDLDGYTTSMEDDDDEGDMDEDGSHHNFDASNNCQDEAEHDFDQDEIIRQLPLSLQEKCKLKEDTDDSDMNIKSSTDECNQKAGPSSITTKERIFKRERQRYFELSLCQSSLQHDCISGFLLKQSMVDPYVWRRVHCVLTDDHIWFMSRIHTRLIEDETTNKDGDADPQHDKNDNTVEANGVGEQLQPSFYSFVKHRSLELTRALLLQPSKEKPRAPLFKTPFAFELVDSSGIAHRFRASNADVYKRWVAALSSRIVQSYENSLFEFAQLIVRDETEARNRRFMAVAVEPLWEKQRASRLETTLSPHDNSTRDKITDGVTKKSNRHVAMDSPTMTILCFGMEVNEFREQCRHIQAIFPAQHPVFAMTRATTNIVRSNSSIANENGSSSKPELPCIPTEGAIRLDLKTQALIKSAWDEAIRLGSRATKITVKLQLAASGGAGGVGGETTGGGNVNNANHTTVATHMPRSLETICQHLEYVITGSFRGHSPRGGSSAQGNGRSDNTRQFPPPIDMFDALLGELQTMAAGSSQ